MIFKCGLWISDLNTDIYWQEPRTKRSKKFEIHNSQSEIIMRSSVKFGLIFAALGICVKLFIFLSGNEFSRIDMYLRLAMPLLLLPVMFLGIRYRKKQNGGYIIFKDVIKEGLAIGISGALVFTVYIYAHNVFLNVPARQQKLQEDITAIREFAQKNNKSQDEIDKNIAARTDFYDPFHQTTSALFGLLIFSLICSIICSTFLIENPPPAQPRS